MLNALKLKQKTLGTRRKMASSRCCKSFQLYFLSIGEDLVLSLFLENGHCLFPLDGNSFTYLKQSKLEPADNLSFSKPKSFSYVHCPPIRLTDNVFTDSWACKSQPECSVDYIALQPPPLSACVITLNVQGNESQRAHTSIPDISWDSPEYYSSWLCRLFVTLQS